MSVARKGVHGVFTSDRLSFINKAMLGSQHFSFLLELLTTLPKSLRRCGLHYPKGFDLDWRGRGEVVSEHVIARKHVIAHYFFVYICTSIAGMYYRVPIMN